MEQEVFLWGLTPQEFQKMLINALEQVLEPLKPAKESTVPKSKKLLRFTLDDGTKNERTILSGVHAFYEPE